MSSYAVFSSKLKNIPAKFLIVTRSVKLHLIGLDLNLMQASANQKPGIIDWFYEFNWEKAQKAENISDPAEVIACTPNIFKNEFPLKIHMYVTLFV